MNIRNALTVLYLLLLQVVDVVAQLLDVVITYTIHHTFIEPHVAFIVVLTVVTEQPLLYTQLILDYTPLILIALVAEVLGEVTDKHVEHLSHYPAAEQMTVWKTDVEVVEIELDRLEDRVIIWKDGYHAVVNSCNITGLHCEQRGNIHTSALQSLQTLLRLGYGGFSFLQYNGSHTAVLTDYYTSCNMLMLRNFELSATLRAYNFSLFHFD